MSKYKWKAVKWLNRDVMLIPRSINFELNPSFEVKLRKRYGGNWRTGLKYEDDVILRPSYELGYIFGTFLGDGSSHNGIHKGSHIGSVRWYFGKHEIGKANKLIKCILKSIDKECKLYYRKNIIQIILYYKPLSDFLQRFGKKRAKQLPNEYLVNNREYLKGVLDGLIDSDGHIERGGRIRFYNTSRKLIELFNVTTYLLTGIFPNNLMPRIKKRGLTNVNIENFNQSYIAEIINTGAKRLTEDYQIAKLLECSKTDLYVKVYDLEVDCPTHSFIANNAIVHNSICVTRIVSGAGVPQLTSVMECSKVAKKYNIPIISDGGIRHSGDITKAIAAGASAVMIGSLLAGTEESPGKAIIKNGRKYKIYRGSTSFDAIISRKERLDSAEMDSFIDEVVPEGVESTVPFKGKLSEVIYQLIGGLKSGMSYCGANSINELMESGEFIKISNASLMESHSHDVDVK